MTDPIHTSATDVLAEVLSHLEEQLAASPDDPLLQEECESLSCFLEGAHTPPPLEDRDDHEIITDVAALEHVCKQLASSDLVTIDIETTGLDPEEDHIVGVAIYDGINPPAYIPLRHVDNDGALLPGQLAPAIVFPRLNETLQGKRHLAHNARFDRRFLEKEGLHVEFTEDTMLMLYLEHSKQRLNLKDAAKSRLYEPDWSIEIQDAHRKPIAEVAMYACKDVVHTRRLHDHLLEQGEVPLTLYEEVEIPLQHVLDTMERNGVPMNEKIREGILQQLDDMKARAKEAWDEVPGEKDVNPNSSKQVAEFLYDHLGLECKALTDTGQRSTSEDALEPHRDHPAVKVLLDLKRIDSMSSKVRNWGDHICPDGKVRPDINQCRAVTGRLSISKPGLHQVPKPLVVQGVTINPRTIFQPREGYRFILADYRQQEICVLAHVSQDKTLIAAVLRGDDLHAAAAMVLFGRDSIDDVTPEQRSQAKALQFAMLYGQGPEALARKLGISLKEAKALMATYFERFPGVKAFFEEKLEQARRTGVMTDMFGRRRVFDHLRRSKKNAKAREEQREAMNFLAQGAAATITKLAMLNIHREYRDDPEVNLILQVHDEVVLEAPDEKADAVAARLPELMTSLTFDGKPVEVPLSVDVKVVRNWGEAK